MTRFLLWLSALTIVMDILGCAGVSPIKPLDANSPAMQGNGFTVTPPQGKDWLYSGSVSAVAFYRLLNTPQGRVSSEFEPQTFVVTIETQVANSDDIATVDGLLRYAGRFVTTLSPERRQQLLDHKTSAYRDQETDCVRFEGVIEEQPRKRLLEIRGSGFICRHPSSPRHVVRGAYSERHVHGGDAQPSEMAVREAEAVLKSVTFTSLR